jgi:hypothetical protein
MKKSLAILAIAALSVATYAQTTVSSANVVGYSKITIPSNDYALVSTSFISTNNTIEGLFGELPTGSLILFWNPTAQGYTSVSKTFGGWGAGGTNIIERGSGVFVKLPAGAESVELTVSGDVPNDGSTPVVTLEGYALLSYPYSIDIPFGDTALATNASTGDIISFWDNGWKSYSKTFGGWGTFATNTLKMGQAFFYRSTSTKQLDEVKPYDLSRE